MLREVGARGCRANQVEKRSIHIARLFVARAYFVNSVYSAQRNDEMRDWALTFDLHVDGDEAFPELPLGRNALLVGEVLCFLGNLVGAAEPHVVDGKAQLAAFDED